MLRSVAVSLSDDVELCSINLLSLSMDDGGKFRQPISTRHLEATTGMFTFFVRCCVCAVSVLTAFHTDRCRL